MHNSSKVIKPPFKGRHDHLLEDGSTCSGPRFLDRDGARFAISLDPI